MIFKLFIFKEIKRYPLFFLLISFTLFLGTSGLIGINVISGQIQNQLKLNAKELLTSDLCVTARRPLFQNEIDHINRIIEGKFLKRYELLDVYSMIRHERTGQTRLVEIRAVENEFPFYGNLKVQKGNFRSSGFFISKDLASLWSVREGDQFKIGENFYNVLGIIQEDSSQGIRGFALAPRVYLPLVELKKNGLLKTGATGSFSHHFKLSKDLSPKAVFEIKSKMIKGLNDRAVKVILPEESSEQTGRTLNYLTDFMSLAALVGLLLALIGIFYLYQSHLIERLKDLSLFHLLGISKFQIISGLLIQFSLLFFLVVLCDYILLVPVLKLISPVISSVLGLDLPSKPNFSTTFQTLPLLFALVISIIVPLVFALMRTGLIAQLKSRRIVFGKFYLKDFFPFLFLFWFFAVQLSHSYKTGSLFFLGMVFILLVSSGVVFLLQYLLLKFSKQSLLNPRIETGLAIRNIIRSGSKLTLSFVSLTLGAALISLILQLDLLVKNEFTLDNRKPALFVFDIQEDQIEDLKQFSSQVGNELENITPMIRARLEKINGQAVERVEESGEQTRDAEMESRFRNRGINLTYRSELTSAEKIVSGEPFPKNASNRTEAYISLEKRFASRMGISLGDKLTFDVQGIEIHAIVRNFREVKWTSFYPNFFVNFEPGFIDEAPKTYLAVINQGVDKYLYQRSVMDKFPNISFIDVEELIKKLSVFFEKSRLAIELVSLLSLGIGMIILYGLSHDQVYRRYYDIALLKTLGLSHFQIRFQLIIEFGAIFLLAIICGFTTGIGLASLIGKEVFKVGPIFEFSHLMPPFFGLSVICLITIILASRKAVKANPRELLSDI